MDQLRASKCNPLWKLSMRWATTIETDLKKKWVISTLCGLKKKKRHLLTDTSLNAEGGRQRTRKQMSQWKKGDKISILRRESPFPPSFHQLLTRLFRCEDITSNSKINLLVSVYDGVSSGLNTDIEKPRTALCSSFKPDRPNNDQVPMNGRNQETCRTTLCSAAWIMKGWQGNNNEETGGGGIKPNTCPREAPKTKQF